MLPLFNKLAYFQLIVHTSTPKGIKSFYNRFKTNINDNVCEYLWYVACLAGFLEEPESRERALSPARQALVRK